MKAWLAPYQWERQSAPGTDSRHRGAWGKRGEAQLGREPWKPHQVEAGRCLPTHALRPVRAGQGHKATQPLQEFFTKVNLPLQAGTQ